MRIKPNLKNTVIIGYHLSNGYIHLYCIDPLSYVSYGRWTGKYSIKSKNPKGNIISNL